MINVKIPRKHSVKSTKKLKNALKKAISKSKKPSKPIKRAPSKPKKAKPIKKQARPVKQAKPVKKAFKKLIKRVKPVKKQIKQTKKPIKRVKQVKKQAKPVKKAGMTPINRGKSTKKQAKPKRYAIQPPPRKKITKMSVDPIRLKDYQKEYLLDLIGDEGLFIIRKIGLSEVCENDLVDYLEMKPTRIRRHLYKLYDRGIARLRQERAANGWRTYYWKLDQDRIDNFAK